MPSEDTPAFASKKLSKDRLFHEGYWERPKLEQRKKGDPTDLQIFAAVGRALTSWEKCQDNLSHILSIMMPSAHATPHVGRLFGSVENVPGRIAAIRAVAEVHFREHWNIPAVKQPLNALLKEIERANFRRNDIAHGQVLGSSIIRTGQDDSTINEFSGYMLIAPSYMTGRNSVYPVSANLDDDKFSFFTSLYRFNSSDIQSYARKFDSINPKIFEVLSYLKIVEKFHMPKIVVKYMFPDVSPHDLEKLLD